MVVDGFEVCESFDPFTFPGGADEGNSWTGTVGTHNASAQLFSVDNCGGEVCDEISISFQIVTCDGGDIVCPPNVTIRCDQDVNDLSVTGEATFDCDATVQVNFMDELIRETCPQQIERTWTATVQRINTSPCVSMRLAHWDFSGPSSGSLCGDFGGDPLGGSGVPASSTDRGLSLIHI